MSQYSTSNNQFVSRSNHVECKCGLPSPLMTTLTYVNQGHRFFGCRMYKSQRYKKCSHFAWYDEEMSQRAKEVISSMHQKLNQEKFKLNEAIIREDQLKLKIKFLKMMNKFIMGMTLVLLIGLIVSNVIN
ncbi:unnamed protein product [Vicia faba]|uniref:GRF-type domain-containing protein n=1 Tax=Vicia faba TaxID=3906 RepID=A0AAV0Z3Y5_VICFA|nr:unnamed protein product [Vicia faba]